MITKYKNLSELFEKFDRYLFPLAIAVIFIFVLYDKYQKATGKTCIEQVPIYNKTKTGIIGTYCKTYA